MNAQPTRSGRKTDTLQAGIEAALRRAAHKARERAKEVRQRDARDSHDTSPSQYMTYK